MTKGIDQQRPPRTIMEVFKMLPEGTLAEVIDGTLYMSPAPNSAHQDIVSDLGYELLHFAKTTKIGKFHIAPYDVWLDEHSNAVQPDFIFVLSENLSIKKKDAIHGVPDLLIEILSPSNSKHDTIRKKQLYEKFGVKEYWIINPNTKETTGYSLKDGIYSPLENGFGKLKSVLLDHEFTF